MASVPEAVLASAWRARAEPVMLLEVFCVRMRTCVRTCSVAAETHVSILSAGAGIINLVSLLFPTDRIIAIFTLPAFSRLLVLNPWLFGE